MGRIRVTGAVRCWALTQLPAGGTRGRAGLVGPLLGTCSFSTFSLSPEKRKDIRRLAEEKVKEDRKRNFHPEKEANQDLFQLNTVAEEHAARLSAIADRATTPDAVKDLLDKDVMPDIHNTMSSHKDSPEVQERSLLLLWTLSKNSGDFAGHVFNSMFALRIPSLVLEVARSYQHSVSIQNHAATVLYYLANTRNLHTANRMLLDDVVDWLVRNLTTTHVDNDSVVQYALLPLFAFVRDGKLRPILASRCDPATVVVGVLRKHESVPAVALRGFAVLSQLANTDDATRESVVRAGATETVLRGLKLHAYDDIQVAQRGLSFLCLLSLSQNTIDQLVSHGGPQLCCQVLDAHPEDPVLQETGAAFFQSVATSISHQRAVLDGGALDALARMVLNHSSSAHVMETVVKALCNLTRTGHTLMFDQDLASRILALFSTHSDHREVSEAIATFFFALRVVDPVNCARVVGAPRTDLPSSSSIELWRPFLLKKQ